jgi:shikimate kinase
LAKSEQGRLLPVQQMNQPEANLYLVGFMGTGKTTVGRSVAQILGYEPYDSDVEIERAAGKTIPEIFAQDGEPAFRVKERAFIESGHPDTRSVVACGGGLVVQPGMLDLLKKRGVVICLHASFETILKRTQNNRHRPLLNVEDPMERIRTLYAEREPVYRQAGTMILTDGRSLTDVVNHVVRTYRREAAEFGR